MPGKLGHGWFQGYVHTSIFVPRLIIIPLLAALSIAGCGKKGPLYLPQAVAAVAAAALPVTPTDPHRR